MPYQCGSCRFDFLSGWKLRDEHCSSSEHSKPVYGDDLAATAAKKPYACGSCNKLFSSGYRARNEHCQATGHRRPEYECDRCDGNFNSELTRFHHMRHYNHFMFEGRQCTETLPTKEQRVEHEADSHLLCADCDREFDNRHDIHQHRKSSAHVNFAVVCPFCNISFHTATGLTNHIESSGCRNARNMDRDTLYDFVRSRDPLSTITNKLLDDWHGSEKTSLATDWAWDGNGFQCFYFCFKSFHTLNDLNQHLQSPIHQKTLYHCTNTHCRREFVLLGGLVNHLESECCGAMRFNRVQSGVENMMAGGRLLH